MASKVCASRDQAGDGAVAASAFAGPVLPGDDFQSLCRRRHGNAARAIMLASFDMHDLRKEAASNDRVSMPFEDWGNGSTMMRMNCCVV